MARTDAIVLGAGIVGTSVALQLAKRGLSVALVDRKGVGQETSYGNSGVIEGSTVFPAAFPNDLRALMRVAFKRATEANYHFSFLPQVAPWLWAFRRYSQPKRLIETARINRPLFSRAVGEHETLMQESDATHLLRMNGWMKLYSRDNALERLRPEFEIAKEFGLPLETLDAKGAQTLEPNLRPVFSHAVFWPKAASISNPLALTRAYAKRFTALGGVLVNDQVAYTTTTTAGGGNVSNGVGQIFVINIADPIEFVVAHLATVGAMAGASRPTRARSTQATSSSRSALGRRTCSSRSVSSCQWR